MNILYINHYAGSPDMGMEFRPYYLSKEWIKMGHKVTIIAGDYSHLRRKNPQVQNDFDFEYIDGIKYIWVKSGTYSGNGLKRAISMYKFVKKIYVKAARIAKIEKPDIIITSSTYPLDTYAGQKIKRYAKHAKLVHEVHDMWPATLVEIGGMSRINPFVVMMQLAENSAYKNSDRVVSLLPLALPYMKRHGLAKEKFVYIPNGIVAEEWDTMNSIPKTIEKHLQFLRSSKKFIVGYIGGHALSNALNDIIEVAHLLRNTDIQFVLVGDGIEKHNLIMKAKALDLNNIKFFPSVEKKIVPTLLSKFDCAFISSLPSPLYRFGICMNKIFDYMAAGLPIICAITTPQSQVSEADCGICLESGDVEGIAEAISSLSQMGEYERALIGNRGREIVNSKYLYSILAKNFIDAI